MSHINKRYILVLTLGIVSFAARFWILDKHWINPDEGAHLMDAILALDGGIPMIDYNSRQPLYTYSLAGLLHVFGPNYVSGRLLPFFCSIMVGVSVFFLGKVLFDEMTAVLASVIYFFLPLEFMNSLIVKTEPLSTLLTCLSILALSLAFKKDNNRWMVVSGIMAACCFYVRQSAVIIPLVVIIFYGFILSKKGFYARFWPILCFFSGYFAGVLVIIGLYFHVAGYDKKILTDLNPLGFAFITIKKGLLMLTGSSEQVGKTMLANDTDQFPTKFPLYWRYIKDALRMHLFLIIGTVLVFKSMACRSLTLFKEKSNERNAACWMLIVWLLLLGLAYAYFLYVKGFHIDYFREFLPPLTLLFATWARFSVTELGSTEHMKEWLPAGLIIMFCLAVLHVFLPEAFGRATITGLGVAYFVLTYYTHKMDSRHKKSFIMGVTLVTMVLILTGVFQAPLSLSGRMPRLLMVLAITVSPFLFFKLPQENRFKAVYTPVACSVLAGAVIFSMSASMKVVDLTYTAPWSPASLLDTAAFLKTHTAPTDRVMSGAVIWEFQSNRRPFMNITHPLELANRLEKSRIEMLEANIKSNGPEVIILDGYTEKTYLRQLPWLRTYIDVHYEMVHRSDGGKFPVEVYLKKNRPVQRILS